MALTKAAGKNVIAEPVSGYDQMVAGHFHSRAGYRTVRAGGSGDWLLIYTAGGTGRFSITSDIFHAVPGQLVLIAPGTPHDYGVDYNRPVGEQYWEIYWAHFQPRPAWLGWVNWPQVLPGILLCDLRSVDELPRVLALLADMNRVAGRSVRHAQDLAMNLLEQVLLWCDASQNVPAETAVDPRLRKVIDYASQNLTGALDVDMLAEQVGLSVSRFAHLFRQQMGQSPQRYIESLRIRRARQLLERVGLSVKEVAAQTGFRDPFYFANRFRKHVGKSPSEYREGAHFNRPGPA